MELSPRKDEEFLMRQSSELPKGNIDMDRLFLEPMNKKKKARFELDSVDLDSSKNGNHDNVPNLFKQLDGVTR